MMIEMKSNQNREGRGYENKRRETKMGKARKSVWNRLMASVLSAVMVLGLLPISFSDVYAAGTPQSEGVTIYVTNNEGGIPTPVTGADVRFQIDITNKETGIISSYGSLSGAPETAPGYYLIMPVADFEAGSKITLQSATISKAEYFTRNITGIELTSITQCIDAELNKEITGVTVTGNTNLIYNYADQDLVSVTNATGYTLRYKVGSAPTWSDTAKARAPGDYSVDVEISRAGYETVTKTVTAKIAMLSDAFSSTAISNFPYDGNSYYAISSIVMKQGVTGDIYYSVNGGAHTQYTPQIKDAGTYIVNIYLKDASHNNTIIFSKTHTIIVSAGLMNIQDYLRTPNNQTYDGNSYPPIAADDLATLATNYKVEYSSKLDEPYTWVENVTNTNANKYDYKVRFSQKSDNNYYAIYSLTYEIYKANYDFQFVNVEFQSSESKSYSYDASKDERKFNLAIKDKAQVPGDLDETDNYTYAISNLGGNYKAFDSAVINAAGELTVTGVGSIKVTATRVANDTNHQNTSKTMIIHINQTSGMVSFPSMTLNYTLGKNVPDAGKESITGLVATKAPGVGGDIYYSIESNSGLEIKKDTGIITISDRSTLVKKMRENNGTISIEVKAEKQRYSDNYPAETITYTLNISFITISDLSLVYTTAGTMGKNGWYTSDVTLTALNGYKIAGPFKEDNLQYPTSFSDSISITEEGTNKKYIYIYRVDYGCTDRIELAGLKINKKPADNLKFGFPTPVSWEEPGLFYYDEEIEVKLSAKGDTVKKFHWEYYEDQAVGATKTALYSGDVDATWNIYESCYTAKLNIPFTAGEQMRGTISFYAENESGVVSGAATSMVFVYDTINPTCIAELDTANQTVGGRQYYNKDVNVNLTITEANLDEDSVIISVKRDGWVDQVASISAWQSTAGKNTCTFTLSKEGDYEITISGKDKSGNEIETYSLPHFTIDKTSPKMSITYDSENQSAIFTITERNFRRDDVLLTVISQDASGKPVETDIFEDFLQGLYWTKNNDTYSVEVFTLKSANYSFEMNYKDLALNEAVASSNDKIVIDHEAPDTSSMSVQYSVPVFEQVLQFVTFGFYNPSVEVTFTAVDEISGINYFEWTFTPQDDSGDKKSTPLSDILPVTTDTNIGTASLLLSAEKYDQMKGNISFTATDKMGNESNEVTDDKRVIVVDTISPTMKVEYSPADRTDNGNMYYKGAAAATLTVEEANFYAENIIVTATKDGGEAFAISPVWTDVSTKEAPDTHVGTFTLAAPADQSGDGDYVITITYKDFSGNQMTGESGVHSGVYTSGRITIDTLAPVVNVSYSNTNAVNVTNDPEGNVRSYFSAEQVATITIREHNFKAEEVMIDVKAKNISGTDLDQNSCVKKGEWVSEGDVHTIVYTYPGDANYTFDLDYKDTANNTMADRPVDYFTVDMTVPENLAITYSESLMDTILENISFGFYNAKTTVTIKADDSVSGVFGISYNGNQTSQNVKYSNNNKTATTEFELPGSSSDAQYDGYVDFNVQDRSGNKTGTKDEKRIIVDSISPTASVTYTKPALAENQVSYFDKPIQGEITIKEANFYAKDVSVRVSKDGEPATALETNWSNADKDTHIGTFTLSEDGIYVVSISYTDNSKNAMTDYTSQIMTLDTTIEKPVIKINGKTESGRAYRDNVIPAISCEDVNFSKYEITLTRTNFGTKNADVKDLFIKNMKETATGASGSFDTFEVKQENDGIYKMTVSVQDKAGNSATASTVFTVNRFGSVYEYSDYLASLVENGGAYVSSITEDLIITEYNPDQILEDSLQIEVIRDGKPVSDLVFSSSEVNNEITASEDGGWYQYQYSIGKDNFTQDGVYKVSVSTIDATGNTMENNKAAGQAIIFYVDNAAPEITSVLGLENEIIDATKQDVRYTVYDTIGLKSVQVFINGAANGSPVTDFSGDINNYTGSFTMTERGEKQAVRIVVEDLAGNITDTDASTFKSAFSFRKYVTISTNFFVRWYANSPLFWGSMVGIVALTGALVALVVSRRRRPRRKH